MFGKKLWRGVYDMVWYGVVLLSCVVWYGVWYNKPYHTQP